jgi:hypothetical protein|tara:strand:+ start:209 stop:406 length:198 start_codon:yes stop_codon:yes gene_type:complete
MKPEFVLYKIGELVGVASNKVLGVITRSNYWALDEYLGGEIQFVDVLFGSSVSKQYPVEYLVKVK